jgi:hypothetical protein
MKRHIRSIGGALVAARASAHADYELGSVAERVNIAANVASAIQSALSTVKSRAAAARITEIALGFP